MSEVFDATVRDSLSKTYNSTMDDRVLFMDTTVAVPCNCPPAGSDFNVSK